MDITSLFTGQNNSQSQNDNNVNTKSHYFIGNVIDDNLLVEKLKLVRKKLIKKYGIKKDFHYPDLTSTNLIYLGYFTLEVAKLYMEKIISYLCTSVTNKFPKLECQIKNFKMNYDKTYYRIMLQLEDKNDNLKNVIIPYLQSKGIESIYGNRRYEKKSSIDILYFKESQKIEEQKKKFKKKFKILLDYPIDKFIIEKLSLIQGTPIVSRSGTPSTHDDLDFKVIKEFEYTFKGSNNSSNDVNLNKSNGNNNKNSPGNNSTNNSQISNNSNKNSNVNNTNGNNSRNGNASNNGNNKLNNSGNGNGNNSGNSNANSNRNNSVNNNRNGNGNKRNNNENKTRNNKNNYNGNNKNENYVERLIRNNN